MKRLAVVVNERCNISCSYCFNTTHDTVVQRRSEQRGLRPGTIHQVTDALRDLSYDSVTLTGGEPTVSPRGAIWIDALADADITTILISNMVYLPAHLEAKIAAHNGIVVRVSMGGGSAETHNAERDKFEETATNLRKLAARGVRCEVTMVITPSNLDKIPEFEQFCDDIGVIGHVVPVSGVLGDILAAMPESAWEDVVSDLRTPRLQHNVLKAHAYMTGVAAPTGCPLRTQSHVLTQDGDLVGCFFREDVAFGNVEREPAGDVLRRAWSDAVLPASCFGKHCVGVHLH